MAASCLRPEVAMAEGSDLDPTGHGRKSD
jgi:hypothetical protein